MKPIVHYQHLLQICQSVTRTSGSDQTMQWYDPTDDLAEDRKFIWASARGLCAGIKGRILYTSVAEFSTTNARMATATTKNMASIVLVCLILLGSVTDFGESQGTESFKCVHYRMPVANCQGIWLVIVRFHVRCPVGAFCYYCFLGQETSLPLYVGVKPGTYCALCYQGTAKKQL